MEAGFTDLPQIVLMIDNITVFREYYARIEDSLMSLSREGQSVGINLIVTGSQASSIGFRLLANYSNRIAYHCNEKSEYNNLLERCRLEPQEIPGRGLCVIDRRILEFQTALAFPGEKEIERVQRMKEFIAENRRLHTGAKVRTDTAGAGGDIPRRHKKGRSGTVRHIIQDTDRSGLRFGGISDDGSFIHRSTAR